MNKYFFDYTTLDNGINVLCYPRNDMHGAGIEVVIGVGSIDETKPINGVSHALEHMIFRGTKDFHNRDDIINYENEFALDIHSAHTADTYTLFEGYGIFSDIERIIYILSQLTCQPSLNPDDWTIEKKIILDEIQRRMDRPWFQLFTVLNKDRFKDDYYYLGHEVAGSQENVKSLDIDSISNHHKEYYTPTNMRISVTGNINIPQIHDLIKKYFPKNNLQSVHHPHRKIQNISSVYSDLNLTTIKKEDSRVYLAFTFPGLSREESPKSRMTSTLLKAIFSDRMDSILWKTLREERGLVYDVSSTNIIEKYYGLFSVQCDFHYEYIDKVIGEVIHAIESIKKGLFDDNMLTNEINIRNKRSLLTFDDIRSAINWLSRELDEDQIRLPEYYVNMRSSITKEDIIICANKIFDWSKVNIGILGPTEKPEIEAILAKYIQNINF
ncbi:MAG: pitrilysin family protein [bacterium]